ncbi:hypothetical protein Cgig2_033425 [Carnegiea gigantea]|uniref:Uncharacterized protein n=1 Tax=Carnegiea gigantea TaxID=171969 RepID=A0A9Q1KWQ7_9CARY|nr:hypothetical protein Cgig2_033425 [Carnegiea gigantea]
MACLLGSSIVKIHTCKQSEYKSSSAFYNYGNKHIPSILCTNKSEFIEDKTNRRGKLRHRGRRGAEKNYTTRAKGTIRNKGMVFEPHNGAWSLPTRRTVDKLRHEAFIGSRTLPTSDPRSGRFLLFISQHLKAISANCLAWTKGQSPAEGSKMLLRLPISTAYCTSLASPKAGFPVNKRNKMTPNEYTSDFAVSSPVARNSGSMYENVPFGCVMKNLVVCSMEISPLEIKRQMPKSLSLHTKLSSRSTFEGFRSPCMMLLGRFEWRNMRTEHNSVAIRILRRTIVLAVEPVFKASTLKILINEGPRFGAGTNESHQVWMPQFAQNIHLKAWNRDKFKLKGVLNQSGEKYIKQFPD